jgi:hypothetical protein
MKTPIPARVFMAVALSLLASAPSIAQLRTTVDGMVVNLGIVPAAVALRADGHRESHPTNPPLGSQHIMITLDDEKTAKRIGDAEVVVEIKDPRGHVERKSLLHTQSGGLADYSELFQFSWSGDYVVKVAITAKRGARSLETRFTIHHSV